MVEAKFEFEPTYPLFMKFVTVKIFPEVEMENYVSREMRNYQIFKVLEQNFAPGGHFRAPKSIFDLHRKNILSYAAPWGHFTEKLEMSFDAGESRLQTYKSFFRKVIRKWENFEVKIFKVVFRRKFQQQLAKFGVKNNRIGELNDRLIKSSSAGSDPRAPEPILRLHGNLP